MRPFKGLRRYSYGDSAIFAGRDDDIASCAARLVSGNERLFLIHGRSGCGKSSFLHAGLIPRLDSLLAKGESTLQPARGIGEVSKEDYAVRLSLDPWRTLGTAIYRLQERLRRSARTSGRGAKRFRKGDVSRDRQEHFLDTDWNTPALAFETLCKCLNLSPPRRTLLLTIDQVEDVFDQEAHEDQKKFFQLLARITYQPVNVKLILALRTDYKARFDDRLQDLKADYVHIKSFYIHPLTKGSMHEAIVTPTVNKVFGFTFEQGLPKTILNDVISSGAEHAHLPLLQVICDRLYSHAKKAADTSPFEITEGDYRASGASSTQIESHLEETLVNFLIKSHKGPALNWAGAADRWMSALSALARTDAAGRVKASPPITEEDLTKIAVEFECFDPSRMIKWLGRPENYILQESYSDGVRHWQLVHDSIATALVEWRTAHYRRLKKDRFDVAENLLNSNSLTWSDLFESEPQRVVLSTMNDMIWDHMIHLYADSLGFLSRLGITLTIDRRFDLKRQSLGPALFSKFLSLPKRLLVVLPSSLSWFRELGNDPQWECVGIPNIYKGWALIGRPDLPIEPLSAALVKGEAYAKESLKKISSALSDGEFKIYAYEGEGIEFFNYLCARVGGDGARAKVIEIEKAPTRHISIKDPMFTALIKEKADLAIGPAPYRALCAQGGFVVYADFDTVYSLSTPEQQRELETLLMHENMAVKLVPGDEPLKLRLLSALLFTTDHVRTRPEEFISFLYNQVLEMTERGGYWLRRKFIKDAIASCYSFIGSQDYGEAYFSPSSPFEYPAEPRYAAPRQLFYALMRERAACDTMLKSLVGSDSGSSKLRCAPVAARAAFKRGQNNYRLYNYGDAAVAFRQVVDILNGTGQINAQD